MLIYNHKQEFIGIDEKDLKSLGFKNLAELQTECSDFADLFVKKPSYIHNFKNFNWIYYILHSDIDEAKVIINAKKKTFSATLELQTIYLSDAPDQVAYAITLEKFRALDSKESSAIEQDIKNTPAPTITLKEEIVEDELPNFEDTPSVELSEPDAFETPAEEKVIEDPYDFDFNAPLDIEDIYMPPGEQTFEDTTEDFEFDHTDHDESPINIYDETQEVEDEQPKIKEKPMLGDYTKATDAADSEYINNLQVSKDYVYDPHVASSELGLPVDLIEEFIGDFIQQSYDFKDDLYTNLSSQDLDGVKLLSHKLKGVAANLRIEDAFEVLSIINSSDNFEEIKANLNHFYKIIAKLEGKEVADNVQEEIVPKEDSTQAELPEEIGLKEELSQEELPTKEQETEESASEDDELFHIGIKQDEDEPLMVESHEIGENDIALEPALLNEDNTLDDSDLLADEELMHFEDHLADHNILEEEAEGEEKNIEDDDTYLIKDDLNESYLDLQEEEKDENLPTLKEESEDEFAADNETLDYNKTATINELGLSEEIVDQLLAEFKSQAEDITNSLETAVETEDFTALKNLAISIKGASDNLRLTKISKILEELTLAYDVQTAKQSLISFKNYINQI